MPTLFKGLFLAFVVLVAVPLAAAIPQPVATSSGPVTGVLSADGSVAIFKGVPYAAPPVGALRWRAPRAPARWSEARPAREFAANCIQNIVPERKPWTQEFMAHGEISEDCLYLNVWTSASAAGEKRPVYFWIHGGGYVEGSGAVPAYDGENLARRGVVVVTINYRLGVFGYLAHPELTKESGRSGNYGSLDQLAALRWVHRNIAAFGGDPRNVTIAGQSAGASSVHNLVASPLARGLFQRAIAESGSGYMAPMQAPRLAEAERDGVRFATAKGAKGLKELRDMPAQALMAKISDGPASSFRPVIDGYFLTDEAGQIYRQGRQTDVPELTGMNMDERSSASDYGLIPAATYQSMLQRRYGASAGRFLALYPNLTQDQSGSSQLAAARDEGLVSMFMWGKLRAQTARSKLYTYYWTHPEPGPDSVRFGAFHTSEVPYVFNSLSQADRPWTDQDRKVAELLGAYWINFMKRGDPNGPGLPAWDAFSAKAPVTMVLGDQPGPRPVAEPDVVKFWEAYLDRPATR